MEALVISGAEYWGFIKNKSLLAFVFHILGSRGFESWPGSRFF